MDGVIEDPSQPRGPWSINENILSNLVIAIEFGRSGRQNRRDNCNTEASTATVVLIICMERDAHLRTSLKKGQLTRNRN